MFWLDIFARVQLCRAGPYLVMASGGHKEDNLALAEHWCDDSDIRQVAAASQLWIIAHQHIALLDSLVLTRTYRVVAQLHRQKLCYWPCVLPLHSLMLQTRMNLMHKDICIVL